MSNLENRFLYELKTFTDPFGSTIKGLADVPTLRDEFAMAALPVFLTYEIDPKSIAEYCYAQADAMMEARK
jgi:hypothetical protein